MKYWAIDYINGELGECEVVYNDQVYKSEEEAAAARIATGRPDLFDVSWYTMPDLEEIYDYHKVNIDESGHISVSAFRSK